MYRILLVDDDAEVLDVNRRFFERIIFRWKSVRFNISNVVSEKI